MAKMKNQKIYSDDSEYLKMLADEQKTYIGRDFSLDLKNGVLTVFALPRRYKAKKETPKSDTPKAERNKREEKFERRA